MGKVDRFDYLEISMAFVMMYFGVNRLQQDKRDGIGVVLAITGFTYVMDVTRHVMR
jgi:hypothetical protein